MLQVARAFLEELLLYCKVPSYILLTEWTNVAFYIIKIQFDMVETKLDIYLDFVSMSKPTILFTPSNSDIKWLRCGQNSNSISNHGISERLAQQLVRFYQLSGPTLLSIPSKFDSKYLRYGQKCYSQPWHLWETSWWLVRQLLRLYLTE